jgi:general secretion pathway protein B
MSYILDALRRADAERTRGQVPDLHAHVGDAPDDEAPERRAGGPVARLGAGLALAGAAALAAWWFLGRPGDAPAPRVPAAAAPLPVAPVSPAPAVTPAPMPAPTPAPLAAAPPAPAFAPPARAIATPAPPAPAAVPPTITEAAAAPRPAPRRVERAPAEPPAAPRTVTPLADLSPELRRALPPLRFGGAIGSPDPGSRVLIVDGSLLHEGDEAAPGVKLREIRLRSAVVEFRGRLVELPY